MLAGFPARHCSVGQTTSLHCFYLRTWTERDCGSRLSPTERPSDGPRTVPLLKPRHMFCALGMPTSVASRLLELPGDDVFRYMSPSVVCNSRICWTSTYKNVHHSTVRYLYRRALPSSSRKRSCCIPLPAITLTLHPHLSLSLPSTSALYICTSVGKVTSAAVSFR